MHRTGQQNKKNVSEAEASCPFFNLKAAAAVAQTLLEARLNNALLLASSQNVALTTLLADNPHFYTQKKDTSLFSGIPCYGTALQE
ncbi:hypothetical protein [Paenibacillus sp. HW567]|uniref:hypothetical protein n=1 Tax=Paenibacillus sp. HW567 TaxID=1034769 RepID=UPI0018DEA6C1|nr:hypothetical protein [Paenibacillus sp. HW567]